MFEYILSHDGGKLELYRGFERGLREFVEKNTKYESYLGRSSRDRGEFYPNVAKVNGIIAHELEVLIVTPNIWDYLPLKTKENSIEPIS